MVDNLREKNITKEDIDKNRLGIHCNEKKLIIYC